MLLLSLVASFAVLPSLAASAPSKNWTLVGTDFNQSSFTIQPYVSNGYIGQRLPVEGMGYSEIQPINDTYGTNGWPLFDKRFTAALVAGFYDSQPNTTGTNFPQASVSAASALGSAHLIGNGQVNATEQPISTLPTWSGLYLTLGNSTYAPGVSPSEVTNWRQSMSIENGVVRTELTWSPAAGGGPVNLTYTVFAHREKANLGVVRLDVDGLSNTSTTVAITDMLDGAGSWRTDFADKGLVNSTNSTIYSAVRPVGISNVTAYVVSKTVVWPYSLPLTESDSCIGSLLTSNASTISRCYTLSAPPSNGTTLTAVKYVGIASTDGFDDPYAVALQAAKNGNATGYGSLLKSHEDAWSRQWESADIEIPGEPDSLEEQLQYAARASLFHITSNVRSGKEPHGRGDNSIAPAGLTADSYAGMIFWDAETWMAPSLVSLFPDYAESILNYRSKLLGATQQNAKQYNLPGSLASWVSGRFGNCTGVGPCYDYEYHLNNDIALLAYQYYSETHNDTWFEEKGWPLMSNVAEMWTGQVDYNQTTQKYITLNETGPDEYANHVNNEAFTNAGINVIMKHAVELGNELGYNVSSKWSEIANNITIEYAPSGIVLEFEGYNATLAVKQADVVLLAYPLEFERSSTALLQDLDFYALATSPAGPGMTYGIYSVVAAALSPIGCASYTYFLAGSQPYSRPPFYQFSEQTSDDYANNGGTNPAFTFLTGHGGWAQTLTHGFTGHRARRHAFYFDPILPPQLKNYTVRGMKWGQNSFDVQLSTESTTIKLVNGSSSVPVEVGPLNQKKGNYTLSPGESLTVPTRSTSGTLINNNVAQCRPVLSNDTYFHQQMSDHTAGEYSLAAVDGSNATLWQPSSSGPSSFTVDLGSERSIYGFHLNWGQNPAESFSVATGNSADNLTAVPNLNGTVTISAPFSIAQQAEVAVKVGNTTDVSLGNSTVSGRYVQLTVQGSQLDNREGPTVAEFAVLAQ